MPDFDRDLSQYDEVFAMDDSGESDESVDNQAPAGVPDALAFEPEPDASAQVGLDPMQQAQTTDQPAHFGHVAEAIRRSEREKAELMAQRAYEQGVIAAQRMMQEQYQPAQEESYIPDLLDDPDGYAQYVQDMAEQRAMSIVQQQQEQMQHERGFYQSLEYARHAVGEQAWQQFYTAALQASEKLPALRQQIETSQNPGLDIIQIGRMFSGDRDSIRNEVMSELAQQQAQAASQKQLPRGVGAGLASAATASSERPSVSSFEAIAKNPADWENLKNNIFSM